MSRDNKTWNFSSWNKDNTGKYLESRRYGTSHYGTWKIPVNIKRQ